MPELPHQYLLFMLCEEKKCRSPVKQENSYKMQLAVLAYAFYFSLSSGAEVAGTSVADCGWARPSAK
jgi:hypothetical protein